MKCCVVVAASTPAVSRGNVASLSGVSRAANRVPVAAPIGRSFALCATNNDDTSTASSSSPSSSSSPLPPPEPLMSRRTALALGITVASVASVAPSPARAASSPSSSPSPPSFAPTEDEWRARLSPEAFDVLRGYGTERPFSSPLVSEKRKGTYVCAGCKSKLFSSSAKYDAGTGWPSFSSTVSARAVVESVDTRFGMTRTAVECSTCGCHLGHVFDDGPEESTGGLRYCINGIALEFEPET